MFSSVTKTLDVRRRTVCQMHVNNLSLLGAESVATAKLQSLDPGRENAMFRAN